MECLPPSRLSSYDSHEIPLGVDGASAESAEAWVGEGGQEHQYVVTRADGGLLERLARQANDVRVRAGDWVMREGESAEADPELLSRLEN